MRSLLCLAAALLLGGCATGGPPASSADLRFPAPNGDGDSWKDTTGVEYRLGLVNTPELDECFGPQARAFRQRVTADGFTARAYDTDRYGRSVSVVTLADGRDLNVLLAREGYANDRYLEEFRGDAPSLAAQLDTAFAAAKGERAGLWGACEGAAAVPTGTATRMTATPPTAAPTTAPTTAPAARADCSPAYPTLCLPPSGPDLDCGDIPDRRFPVLAPDPYRFDGGGDGVGCEGG